MTATVIPIASKRKEKYYGGAIENGILRYTSVSALSRMNHAEDGGCMRKFWFRYKKRIPEPEKEFRGKGEVFHGQVDHYLKTGEDGLGREARPVRDRLPPPVPGLLTEHGLHDLPREPEEKMHDPFASLLVLNGVPITGFMDLAIPPELCDESIIEKDGKLLVVQNPPGTFEISDNKFYADPEKWGATDEELVELSQMNGYAAWGFIKWPYAQFARLSHVYGRTDERRKPFAMKSSILVPRRDIEGKWYGYFGDVIGTAKVVAKEENEERVPANTGSCNAYGGCAYRAQCKAYNNQTPLERLALSVGASSGGHGKDRMASLFGNKSAAATPPPPPAAVPPPPNGAKPAGWVAQHAAPSAPPAPPPSSAKGVAAPPAPTATTGVLTASQAQQQTDYILPNGATGKFLCMTGGKFSFLPIDTNGVPTAAPVLLEGNIPITLAGQAAPAPTPPAPAAAPPPPPTAAPPAAAAAAAPAAPTAQKKGKRSLGAEATAGMETKTTPAAAPAPAANTGVLAGNWLFVDCIPGVPFNTLDGYVNAAADQLAQQHGVVDIRFPSNNESPLGFSRWKGALAALLKASPPQGVYTIRSGSDFADVAIEALSAFYGPCIVRSTR